MKLLFIYGPPATGKLTVSNEIARLTGFKVFHNHLTVDAVLPIFDFGTPSFGKLINLFRFETVAEAARNDLNLIYTFCYAKDLDDFHVQEITKAVEENGGEVCFVLLKCERKELEIRVLAESRQKFEKIKSLALLKELLEKYELFTPVPDRESLVVDNTNLSPQEAAKQIIEQFQLTEL